MQFLAKLQEYEKEHPQGEKPADAPAAEIEKPAADADKPASEPDKPAAEPAIAPTPERLNELFKEAPEVQAALEAHPKVKEQVFEMARQLAAADPILQAIPTKADADFHIQNTNELLGLKTASMRLVRDPETTPQFLEAFDSAYMHVDEKGQPVKDAAGNIVYGEDYKPAINALVAREVGGYKKQFATEMEQLRGRLANGVYPNEAAKEADQQRLDNLQMGSDAIEILEMIQTGDYFKENPPELPADATPEMKAYFEKQRSELAEERRKLDEKTGAVAKQDRTATAQKFDVAVRTEAGTKAGSMITTILKQKEAAGQYIPQFYLEEKYVDADRNSPTFGQETTLPAIYMRIWNAYQREIGLGPDGKPFPETDMRAVNEKVQYELRNPNDATKAALVEWHGKQQAKRIPRLLDAEIKRIDGLVKKDQEILGQRSAARAQAAQLEPRSAGSSLPAGATDAEILKQVQQEMDANPEARGWDDMEREARRATRFRQLRAGGVKK
jgi:hypothetical protein